MTQLAIKKANRKSADDALIPLINIVFLLLIFFMVAGSIQPSIPVDINHPVAANINNPIKPLTVQIVLTKNNDIYWNDEAMPLEKLKRTMTNNTPSNINLHVDLQVKAIELEPILNVIRAHKITNINLITQQQGQS